MTGNPAPQESNTRLPTGGKKPLVSIVIRAFNEEKHIGRLLDGILQQTVQDAEIILVDSGSTDATLAIASSYPVKVVHIRPDEFTFGRSLNLGISHARGDLIAIASAHVYPVYPDWLENLIAPFEDPQVALTYGKQRGNTSTKFSEHQIFARWFPDVSNANQTHPFCNNANAAIRRELWEKHPYDETISGLEDLAWARWAMEHGYKLAYVAEAEIIHVHNESPRNVYNRYRREAMAFKGIFPEERFQLHDLIRLVISNIATDLWHALRQGAILTHFKSIIWFRWNQFWGTYHGYRQSGPLTWQLRKTFYYPRGLNAQSTAARRNIEPIRYNDAND